MPLRTSIQQIDRLVAIDAKGRRHGILVYAEVVEERGFWRVRRTCRDTTHRLANGTLLALRADGTLVDEAHGLSLTPIPAAVERRTPPENDTGRRPVPRAPQGAMPA